MRRILLCLLTIGVAAAQTNFAGHYYLQNLRDAASELLLRPDGSFEFVFAYGAADYSAKGTWRAQEDSVILNSTPLKDAAPFKFAASRASKEEAILIHVQAPNGGGVPNIDVLLTTAAGPLTARTDSSGIAEFPKTSTSSTAALAIPVYELQTPPFSLNPAHNEFVFQINPDAITQIFFQDEKLTVKDKALIMRHWPDREMRFEQEP